MSRLKLVLIPLAACVVFLVTSSMKQPAAPLVSIPSIKKPVPIESLNFQTITLPSHLEGVQAETILAKAISRVNADELESLEMDVIQRTDIDDINYQMKARYLRGPKQLVRFEADITVDSLTSRFTVISNGNQIRESVRVPGAPKSATVVDLPVVNEGSDDVSLENLAREKLVRSKVFSGVGALITAIQSGLKGPSVRAVRCNDSELIEISGKWAETRSTQDQVPVELRIKDQAGECRVYLDINTLWPYYIEWWTKQNRNGSRRLLMRTEFRNVTINPPLTEERIRQEFMATKAPSQ